VELSMSELRSSKGTNTLKLRVLGALEGRGWVNVPMLSMLARFRPTRAVYIYIERLRRWGLVRRRRVRRGLITYSISKRGQARLDWLRERE
jgi:hypothetical protein